MKNIFAAICVIALSISSVSCREQEELLTSTEAESLHILKEATDNTNTSNITPEFDSEGDPMYPPKK